jgi:HK97 family phage portal protein
VFQRQLTINERYRLQLASGYSAEQRSGEYSSLENPSKWFLDWASGGYSASGVAVNDESALTYAAIYACNRVLAESIAQLPIGLFRTTPDGDTVPATNRPEDRLMSRDPSGGDFLYTSYTFRSTLQFHLGMRGNAHARIYRDGRGGARKLRIIQPHQARAFMHEGALYYEVTIDGVREILMPYDVLHIAALSTDGINGRSPISLLKDTIGIGLGNREQVAKIQKRGGRVEALLTHPNKLNKDQVTSVRENFISAMQRGEIPLLENGLEYKSVSLTPADAEFINTHKLTSRDIAGAYRVPLHMIGDLERATFSNIEHQSLEFVKNTLLPWIKNWEAELNRKLIPFDLQDTYFYRFNVEGMLRGDIRSRMEAYTKAIQWGILNRDEVRSLENRNKIPDGLGEIFLTPLNMAPLTEETVSGDPNTDPNPEQQPANG